MGSGNRCEHRARQGYGRRNRFRPDHEQMESRVLLSTLDCAGQPDSPTTSIVVRQAVAGHVTTHDAERLGSALGRATGANDHRVSAPTAPRFTATAVSATKIKLAWTRVAGAAGYVVGEWVNGAVTRIGSTGNGSTSATISGLSPGTTYAFDVGAFNAAGMTWASYRSVTTRGTLGPPRAPSFTVTAVSTTQINVAWTGVTGATGYLVDELINGVRRQVASMGSGSTSDLVTGLSPGTTYDFDVAAFNAAGTTWASYRSATTPQHNVVANQPIAGTFYSPVKGSLFGANGPSYLDVEEGGTGDCWLMASLAKVAARAPSDIENMFTYDGTAVDNGSLVGLYTVRFFNSAGTAEYVTVDTELPFGGNLYAHPANGVLWVALAEKAYAEANGAGYVTTLDPGSDSYAALWAGDPSWGLSAITGKPASDFPINPSDIAAAWNTGELIVLDSTDEPASSTIVRDHSYALVDYNPSSAAPLDLYNPWGKTLSEFAGVCWLCSETPAFLSQNFIDVSTGSGAAAGLDVHANGLHEGADLPSAFGYGWLRNVPAKADWFRLLESSRSHG